MAAMAGLSRLFRSACFITPSQGWQAPASLRCLSSQAEKEATKPPAEEKTDKAAEGKPKGWFKSLVGVRNLEPSKESHSSQLAANKETVFEIQFHSVKPEFMEDYLNQFQVFTELMDAKQAGSQLVGSFTVEIGDQDEAVHIWEYKGGYPVLNEANRIYRTDQDFIEFRQARNKMLRYRKNQILLKFSFWPEILPRPPSNIYELRSYTLKPGTMNEWGNNWKRGIQFRQTSNEPVAGFFSQIGDLSVVQHVWAYTDLQTRTQIREENWLKPGWDDCVNYTVPLIRHMQSRILIPTPASPLQ